MKNSVWISALKAFAFFLILAGIIAMSAAYYALYDSFDSLPPYHPVQGRLNEKTTDFRVAMFSDFGMRVNGMCAVAKDIMENYHPAFVAFLGDMGLRSNWHEWSYTVKKMHKAFGDTMLFATSGNHDNMQKNSFTTYSWLFGAEDSFWGYGDTLFIMIHTGKGYISEDQFVWLETVLRNFRSLYRRCVIMTHVPPVDPNGVHQHALNKRNANALLSVTDQYNVDLLVCGHVHVYSDIKFGKARLIILPTSGQKVRDPKEKRIGYVRFDFKADGSIIPTPVYFDVDLNNGDFLKDLCTQINLMTIGFSAGLGGTVLGLILLLLGFRLSRSIRGTAR